MAVGEGGQSKRIRLTQERSQPVAAGGETPVDAHARLLRQRVSGRDEELASPSELAAEDLEQELAAFALEMSPHERDAQGSRRVRVARPRIPQRDVDARRNDGGSLA